MKDKLNVVKVANALGITTAIFYLVCIILIWLSPGFSVTIGNYLLHGIDISQLAVQRSFGFSLISFVSGTISGWLMGALFAFIYNKLH